MSLPTKVATRLRAESRRRGITYLDAIRAAYVDHAEDVARAHTASVRRGAIALAPPARRWPPGRVQVALRIPDLELQEIDRAARGLGLDRSSYVAELLSAAD